MFAFGLTGTGPELNDDPPDVSNSLPARGPLRSTDAGASVAVRDVLVVMTSGMMARIWLGTDVAERLGREPGLRVTVVTPDESDRTLAEEHGLQWRPLGRLAAAPLPRRMTGIAGYVLHMALVHRFNAMLDFRGSRERLRQSWRLRKLAIKNGLPASPWFGFPFPRSRFLFRLLQRIYDAPWQRSPSVEQLFEDTKPALLVLTHVQNSFNAPFVLAAKTRGIPTLGFTGSWDQPTTKGPISPGIRRFLVQSRTVARELVSHHGIDPRAIDVVGWLQMDIYKNGGFAISRTAQLAELGLPAHARYVLLGAYTERLGSHEPELCRHISEHLSRHDDCALVVRCHPHDRDWQRQFGALHRPPHVIVLPPEYGNLERLASQVQHAAVVLSSAGTILLDAVALDTPAIAIAPENETEPYYDRVARRYDMEHWAGAIASGGIALARSENELTERISAALADPNAEAAQRSRLRAACLEPFDGRVAERVVSAIARAAGQQSALAQYRVGAP